MLPGSAGPITVAAQLTAAYHASDCADWSLVASDIYLAALMCASSPPMVPQYPLGTCAVPRLLPLSFHLISSSQDRFLVFNLCSERLYDPAIFGGRVGEAWITMGVE